MPPPNPYAALLAGRTQEAFAALAGMRQSVLSRYVTGKSRGLTAPTLARLADAAGLTDAQLGRLVRDAVAWADAEK